MKTKICNRCGINKFINEYGKNSSCTYGVLGICKECNKVKKQLVSNVVIYQDKDLKDEVWQPIKNYEDKYHVSSFGRIKSIKYRRVEGSVKILKGNANKLGYIRVDLVTKRNHKFVHVLVAKAFIPNNFNKPEVNHKNGITSDNRAENLEWATKSEQQIHAQKVLGFKPNIDGLLKQVEKGKTPVNQVDPHTKKVINTYLSQREACKKLGLGKDDIYKVLKNKRKLAGGFKWEYV